MTNTNETDRLIARTISLLRTIHRKRGTTAWRELHTHTVQSFNNDDGFQAVLIKILSEKGSRREIVEPIYSIFDGSSRFSFNTLSSLRRMYLTDIPHDYPYTTRLVHAIAISAASSCKGKDVINYLTTKEWQDELRFCDSILNKLDRFSPEVVIAIWQHLQKMHVFADPKDVSRTASAIKVYEDSISQIKKDMMTRLV